MRPVIAAAGAAGRAASPPDAVLHRHPADGRPTWRAATSRTSSDGGAQLQGHERAGRGGHRPARRAATTWPSANCCTKPGRPSASLSDRVSNADVDALYEAGLRGRGPGRQADRRRRRRLPAAVRPAGSRRPRSLAALRGTIHVPFEFESAGSQIIFYDPGVDYREAEQARARHAPAHFRSWPPPSDARRRPWTPTHASSWPAADTLSGGAARAPPRRRLRRSSGLAGRADLTDAGRVAAFFAWARPEYVFLAAGESGGIAANRDCPADLMLDNLLVQPPTCSMRPTSGVRKLLYLASSCTTRGSRRSRCGRVAADRAAGADE